MAEIKLAVSRENYLNWIEQGLKQFGIVKEHEALRMFLIERVDEDGVLLVTIRVEPEVKIIEYG